MDIAVKLSGDFETHFQEDDVHERSGRGSEGLFADDAGNEFAVLDEDFGVGHGQPLERTAILRIVVSRVSSEGVEEKKGVSSSRQSPLPSLLPSP